MKNDQKKEVEEQVQEEKRDDCEKRLKEWEEKYKRALADYQNLEKRVREEKIHWIKIANKELLLRLLPVLDTLLLAKQHSQDQSLQVSVRQFLDTVKSEGVELIKTEGKEFDPKLMEGIQIVEGQEGKVVAELRPGYLLNGIVLRPAQVTVGSEKLNQEEKN